MYSAPALPLNASFFSVVVADRGWQVPVPLQVWLQDSSLYQS